jgi:hypothetical protein
MPFAAGGTICPIILGWPPYLSFGRRGRLAEKLRVKVGTPLVSYYALGGHLCNTA